MGGGQKGKRGADPPIQKGSGSITKKKPEAKAADGAAKPRKQKAAKGTRELPDDDALIASLISCAAGSEKPAKRTPEKQEDLDMELVAALAAEACHTSRHGGCDSETPEEPLPPSYLDDEEDHLSLEEDELFDKKSADAPDDDGAMIASLIDGAAEKNMDMELVAALAADAMTPSGKGGQQRSFADDVERSASDSALAADVDDFMNGSSESFALEAQQEVERGDSAASGASTEREGDDEPQPEAAGVEGEAEGSGNDSRNWQQRRPDGKATPSGASAAIAPSCGKTQPQLESVCA
eukprot:Tamp_07181.p2 GENE.Tamp_07181~~Tamp_07181.p2  ORF type:complete len:303 (-),score=89.71 Tamp_07181:1644-2528(-)